MSRTLLVTGASGHLGRRTLEFLLEGGTTDRLVATTRNPASLADLAARGVEVRTADFDDPASVEAAFAGADRVLIVSTDALDRPGRRVEQHRRAIAAAVKAGVGSIVYTSLLAPDEGSPVSIAVDHRETEAALVASGLGWTALRNNLYAENLLAGLPAAIASGTRYTATAGGGVSYVTREDCARVAAAALLATTDLGVVDVTGPETLTEVEIAGLATALTGKPIQVVEVPPDGLRQGLIGAGLPAEVADLLVTFEVATAQGRLASVSDAVPRLTGRPATRVVDFLAAHRGALG